MAYQLPLHLRLPVEPPATEPPATEPPATEPPATEPPATEPPATEPPAAAPEVHELAVVGKRVFIKEDAGVVFKVTKKVVAVGYDDRSWEWMTHDVFAQAVFPELTLDADKALVGVWYDILNKKLRPCAFLYGVTCSVKGDWQLFDKYMPPPPEPEEIYSAPPLAMSLACGDPVTVPGALLPVAVPAKGPRKKVAVDAPFHFGGVVTGLETEKRRWAMVR